MFVRCPHLGPCLSASIWVHICQVPPSVSVFVSLHLGPCLSDASICVNVCQPPSVSMFDSLHLGPWLSGASAPCCQPPSGSKLVRCCWSMLLASISLSGASVWVHVCQPPSGSMFVRCLHLCPCCQPPSGSMFASLHLDPWLSGASICVHVVSLHAYHSGTLPPAVQVQCSVGPIKKSSCCKTNITNDMDPFFSLDLGRT